MKRYGAMERVLGRHWAKAVGVALAGILLASLLSFDLYDPTLTNLRYPMDGIVNLAGLPGALLGGTLVEFFGASVILLPILLVNWVLVSAAPGAWPARLLHTATALICLTTLHALAAGEGQAPGLTAPGLAGLAGGRWVLRTVGLFPGLVLLLPTLAYALHRVLHLPWMRAVLADGRLFAVYFSRRAGAAAISLAKNLRESRSQGAMGRMSAPARLQRRLLAGAAWLAALWAGRRWSWGGWLGLRRPEVGGTSPAAGRPNSPAQNRKGRRKMQVAESPSRPAAGDGFDSWLSALGDVPSEPEHLERS